MCIYININLKRIYRYIYIHPIQKLFCLLLYGDVTQKCETFPNHMTFTIFSSISGEHSLAEIGFAERSAGKCKHLICVYPVSWYLYQYLYLYLYLSIYIYARVCVPNIYIYVLYIYMFYIYICSIYIYLCRYIYISYLYIHVLYMYTTYIQYILYSYIYIIHYVYMLYIYIS